MFRSIINRVRLGLREWLRVEDDLAELYQAIASLVESVRDLNEGNRHTSTKLDAHQRRLDAQSKDLALVHGKIEAVDKKTTVFRDAESKFQQGVSAIRALTERSDTAYTRATEALNAVNDLEEVLNKAFPKKLAIANEPSLSYKPVQRRAR